jgi:hypothetical protein
MYALLARIFGFGVVPLDQEAMALLGENER